MRSEAHSLRLLRGALLAGAAAHLAATFAVATLLVPEPSRSAAFWPRVLWAGFLVLLLWTALAAFCEVVLGPRRHAAVAGIAPALVLIVLVYALSSFLLLVLASWLPVGEVGHRLHWASQIVRLAMLVFMVVGLVVSLIGARAGATELPDGVPRPARLAQRLRLAAQALERAGRSAVAREVRHLGERIEYALPQAGPITEGGGYAALRDDVARLLADLASPHPGDAEVGDEPLLERTFTLSGSVDALVESMKRS